MLGNSVKNLLSHSSEIGTLALRSLSSGGVKDQPEKVAGENRPTTMKTPSDMQKHLESLGASGNSNAAYSQPSAAATRANVMNTTTKNWLQRFQPKGETLYGNPPARDPRLPPRDPASENPYKDDPYTSLALPHIVEPTSPFHTRRTLTAEILASGLNSRIVALDVGDAVYKITFGRTPTSESIYYMSLDQLKELLKDPSSIPDKLALPPTSLGSGEMNISRRVCIEPTLVTVSNVAAAEVDGVKVADGGGQQIVLTNTSHFGPNEPWTLPAH